MGGCARSSHMVSSTLSGEKSPRCRPVYEQDPSAWAHVDALSCCKCLIPRRLAIPVARFCLPANQLSAKTRKRDRNFRRTRFISVEEDSQYQRGKQATLESRMPASSIWGHPHTVTAPSPSKTHALANGIPFSQSTSRPTPIGTPTKQQHFYQQQPPASYPQQQVPYNPRLSTSSSVSSTNSAAAAGMPMSPGQNSATSTSAGGTSGIGNEGSVYLSAASSLTGVGLGGNEVDLNATLHADSGYMIRENGNLHHVVEDAAPMRMPLNLEEDDEEHAYSREQGYYAAKSANPSINLFQHTDDAFLGPQQSQPVSIPLSTPGRLAPGITGGTAGGTVDHYDGHSVQQQIGSTGNGGRILQQPSPSRAAGPSAGSISPLPWGRNNVSNINHHNLHHHHGNNMGNNNNQVQRNAGFAGGTSVQNAPNGFDRPTSAMSGRGYGYGEPMNSREGSGGSGRETPGGNGNPNANANGLQGIGIARAESPAMAVSPISTQLYLCVRSDCLYSSLNPIGAHRPGCENRSCARRSQPTSSIAEHAGEGFANLGHDPKPESFRRQSYGLELE